MMPWNDNELMDAQIALRENLRIGFACADNIELSAEDVGRR